MPDDSVYLNSLQGGTSYIEARDSDRHDFVAALDREMVGENLIYYGAPGTGKSHKIDTFTTDSNSVITVFHPDTQYSDFAGCLKPSMNNDSIEYRFRPGPFIKAVCLASAKPDTMCYLVIEEINRAAAAAVFGEIFQLLDRNNTGVSKYAIDVSDPDMSQYLNTNAPQTMNSGKLSIPSNLTILATMNSSDQAVMPMDTAFKRRWKFEYIPIDFTHCPSGTLRFVVDGGQASISWKDFARAINDELAAMDIPEDRLMGPWFLDSIELQSEESSKASLCGKLFVYLWDDVLRHNDRSQIFGADIRNYGELVKCFSQASGVFSEALEREFSASSSFTILRENDNTTVESTENNLAIENISNTE